MTESTDTLTSGACRQTGRQMASGPRAALGKREQVPVVGSSLSLGPSQQRLDEALPPQYLRGALRNRKIGFHFARGF
jgi:hypothetical protein